MTTSAFFMGILGIVFTFLPAEVLQTFNIKINESLQLTIQILGALYFAFGMLNWTAKTSHIGGIYNRPIAIANFAHFMIGGLALVKAFISTPHFLSAFWIMAIVYLIFAVVFGVLLFRHPKN